MADLTDEIRDRLAEQVNFGFWFKPDDAHTVIRFATSWATTGENVEKLLKILDSI